MVTGTREKTQEGQGLTASEVERSRETHGSNRLTRRRGKGFFRQLLERFGDPVIRILLFALGVNLVLSLRGGDPTETVGIAVAVLLATLISTLSEYSSARAFSRLCASSLHDTCRVRREGEICEIPISEVVVGDTVLLLSGDGVPADGRLLRGELSVDQSAMTGESREIKKRAAGEYTRSPECPSALLRASTVTAGEGELLVTHVGDATLLGEISGEIQEAGQKSPLSRRLEVLAKQISVIGYLAAALVALAYLFNVFFLDSGMEKALILYKLRDLSYLSTHLFRALTLGLSVLVVAVPEGLPMMIAVVLAANVRRMERDQVLVRKSVGIESAGCMNVLFTDKTGTLTEGKMRVEGVLVGGKTEPLSALMRRGGALSDQIRRGFFYCNDASLSSDGRAVGGNATARAILEAVSKYPRPRDVHPTSALPFDSRRKYASVTLGGAVRATFVLGAPECLFPHVTCVMREDGEPSRFHRAEEERTVRAASERGARVLSLCMLEDARDAGSLAGGIRGELCLLCSVILSDPLRREAARSVGALRDAGVHAVMITGDAPATAKSIAERCGILCGAVDTVLTGEELSRLSDREVKAILPRLGAVARALPSDKSRLVRLSQEMGLVVGMTGDGVNDAPALRRADVGFSMGSGTQVAREASDVVLLDDNLSSVVRAVRYGRGVFKSIRKFITLQLTMNLCAVGVSVIAPFLGVDAPVTVVQMLWINLIMDTLGGLAFAGEAPLDEYMREAPKRRDEPILNRYMIDQILLLGGFSVAFLLWFLCSPRVTALFRVTEGNIAHLTAFFALFIFSSVFHCLGARTDRLSLFSGLSKNRVFLFIMLLILCVQITFVYFGGAVLRTVPLTARELTLTALLSAAVIPAELIRKALWRLRGHSSGF